jgi:hypothetical protein
METVSHLTAGDLSDILWNFSWTNIAVRLIPIPFALYGLLILYRRVSRWAFVALTVALAFAVSVRFLGSFVPVVVQMQPLRFMAPAVVLLAIPAGLALQALGRKIGLSGGSSAILAGVLLIAGALWTDRPEALALPPSPDPLGVFLDTHTTTDDRLLVQSIDGYQYEGYEAKAFPLTYNREVIGNTFPEIDDPAQFHHEFLWGKMLSSWQPADLGASLERWGVSWVFVQTDEAHELLAATTGVPSVSVGPYRAFQLPLASTSRFLIGRGQVAAKVNRLNLSDIEAENGLVVLRYRFHPAWRASGGESILRYPIPEDIVGFIAVKNPGRNLTLHFDPRAMLRAPWPDLMPDVPSSQNVELGRMPLAAR